MSVTAGNWINVLYCSTRGDTARYTCVHKWRLHLRELDCPKTLDNRAQDHPPEGDEHHHESYCDASDLKWPGKNQRFEVR